MIASLGLNILILLVVIHGANRQKIKKLVFHDSKLLFRRKYNCPEDSFNLAFFGQSNSANHIPGRRNISTDGNICITIQILNAIILGTNYRSVGGMGM